MILQTFFNTTTGSYLQKRMEGLCTPRHTWCHDANTWHHYAHAIEGACVLCHPHLADCAICSGGGVEAPMQRCSSALPIGHNLPWGRGTGLIVADQQWNIRSITASMQKAATWEATKRPERFPPGRQSALEKCWAGLWLPGTGGHGASQHLPRWWGGQGTCSLQWPSKIEEVL